MLETSGNSAAEPNGSGSTESAQLAPGRTVRRVLMTTDAVGGVWQYALDLARALGTQGIEATLAVMGPPMDDRQRAELMRDGVRFVEAPYKLEWADSPWGDLERAGTWLLDLESKFHPDIVHLNGFYHAVLPWHSPPIVVAHSCVRSWWRAVHGAAAPAEWDRYSGAVVEGLRAARLVITPSLSMMSMLHDEYGGIDRWRVIPNGRALVDQMDDSFPIKTELVFAAGRLWDEAKNVAALSTIAQQLSWRVVIAGDFGGRHAVVSPANVTWLGRLDSTTMLRWYARAAIYVAPALYEPFGLSTLEAAASGCALVLGDIPSLRENWSEAALFVHPRDHQALAAAVQGIIDDLVGRRRLALRAMARARHFTAARMAQAYVAAYQDVLAHAGVGQR